MSASDGEVRRMRVGADTCTILGNNYEATSPAWLGLDMERAEPREQSTLAIAIMGQDAPEDIHLSVPWCHPADQTGDPDDFDCRYRVRPRMKAGKRWKGRKVVNVEFEQTNGEWWLVVTFAGRSRKEHPHARP